MARDSNFPQTLNTDFGNNLLLKQRVQLIWTFSARANVEAKDPATDPLQTRRVSPDCRWNQTNPILLLLLKRVPN